VLHSEKRPDGFIEELDKNLAEIVANPFVENGDKEITVSCSRNGAGIDRRLCIVVELDEREELEIFAADFFEISVDLDGMANVHVVNDTKEIHVDFVAFEHLKGLNDLFVRWLLAFGDAIAVVDLLWPVEA
jgi:hypothetical protein